MFFLLALGCLFVYSASSYSAQISYGDKFFFVKIEKHTWNHMILAYSV